MMFKRFNTSSSAKKKSISSFLLPLLFLLTFFLIIFNKTDYFLIDKVKGYGVDYLLPVTKVIPGILPRPCINVKTPSAP